MNACIYNFILTLDGAAGRFKLAERAAAFFIYPYTTIKRMKQP